MSSVSKFPSSTEAKKAGWFSRRHETEGPHREAQQTYRERLERKRMREEDARAEYAEWKAKRAAN